MNEWEEVRVEGDGAWYKPWEAPTDNFQYWVSDEKWFLLYATGTTLPYQDEIDRACGPMYRMWLEEVL